MARAGLSGSEPGADLSAWLAKIMARLSGSTAPSRAVYITSRSSNHLRLAYDTVHTDVVLRILSFFRILRRAREVFTEVSCYFISLLVSDTSPQKFLCSLQGFFSKLPTSRITAVQSCCRSVKAHAALAVLDVPLMGQPQQPLYCTQTTP